MGGGAELSRVEISMVKIGEISSPELGGAQGLVGFPVKGIGGFSCSGIGGFCSDFSPKISIVRGWPC